METFTIPAIYKNKSVPQLIQIAQKWFNKMIRLRDSENGRFKCISCGQIKSVDQMNAGHYLPTTYGSVRFNPLNCWGQCISCNMHKHGNRVYYRKNLIEKIGLEEVEKLEVIARMRHKFDRTGLIMTIIECKQKCKKL